MRASSYLAENFAGRARPLLVWIQPPFLPELGFPASPDSETVASKWALTLKLLDLSVRVRQGWSGGKGVIPGVATLRPLWSYVRLCARMPASTRPYSEDAVKKKRSECTLVYRLVLF